MRGLPAYNQHQRVVRSVLMLYPYMAWVVRLQSAPRRVVRSGFDVPGAAMVWVVRPQTAPRDLSDPAIGLLMSIGAPTMVHRLD